MSYYTLITDQGIAKEASAHLNGNNISLSEMIFGDGNGSVYDPVSSQTSLANEVFRISLNRIYTDPNNPNYLVLEGHVPYDAGPFYIREVGIIDADGELFAIAKYPETYKVVFTEGSSKDLYVRMILAFANTPAVNLSADLNASVCSEPRVVEIVDQKLANEFQTLFDAAFDAADDGLARKDMSNVLLNDIITKGIAKDDLSNVDMSAYANANLSNVNVDASETIKGLISLATGAEVNAGTDDTKAITPLKLAGILSNFSGGGGSAKSIIVAANDASQDEKDAADFICDGVDDQVEINQAMSNARNQKVFCVLLTKGNFNISSEINVSESVHLTAEDYPALTKTVINISAGASFSMTSPAITLSRNGILSNIYFKNDLTVNTSATCFKNYYNSVVKNCIIDGFNYGCYSTGDDALIFNVKAINCNKGFWSGRNMIMCNAVDCGEGFYSCSNLLFCKAKHTSSSSFNSMSYGIYSCSRVIGCSVEGINFDVENNDITNAKVGYGFFSCSECTGCSASFCREGFYWADGVSACNAYNCGKGFFISDAIAGCYVSRCYIGYSTLDGCASSFANLCYHRSFENTGEISNCYSHVSYGDGFYNCDKITSCHSNSAYGVGFNSCRQLVCCAANPNSSQSGSLAYNNCSDLFYCNN